MSDTARKPIAVAGAALLAFIVVIVLTTDLEPNDPSLAPASEQVTWRTDFHQALAHAGEIGKPVFVVFTQDGCPPCEMMHRKVYPTERIAGLLHERFVAVKIDLTNMTPEQSDLAATFEVRYVPTLVVLDPDGRAVARRTGGLSVQDLHDMLTAALTQIESPAS